MLSNERLTSTAPASACERDLSCGGHGRSDIINAASFSTKPFWAATTARPERGVLEAPRLAVSRGYICLRSDCQVLMSLMMKDKQDISQCEVSCLLFIARGSRCRMARVCCKVDWPGNKCNGRTLGFRIVPSRGM